MRPQPPSKLNSLLTCLATFSLLLSSAPISAEPTITEILDQMIASYGGTEALAKLNKPYEQEWALTAIARNNEQGSDHRTIDLPNRLKIELTYPSKSETRILDGAKGEKIYDKTNHREAKGPGLDAMRLQRMRLYNPLLLKQHAAEIQADFQVEGYYRLGLREDNIVTIYFVNRESLLIDKVKGTLNMGGISMSFLTLYRDYKAVDGVMMAHREVKFAGQVNTAELTLISTRFNL
ncbi:MAG: hypothetical protein L3J28_12375 [Candidatus Polarisedimenticolaceae bacterium]|nr:hypothetical protein [Candidatus Polarisedimenticolaceae bacterium]